MTKSKKEQGKAGRRNYVVIGLVSLCAVTLVSLGWYYLNQDKKGSSHTQSQPAVSAVDVPSITLTARQYLSSGDIKKGLAYYDEKIQHTEDDTVKRQLLIAKVDYLLQANDSAAAVETAKVIVDTYNNQSDAHGALARAYEASGNKPAALTEYKQALANLQGNQPPSRVNPRNVYEAKVEELAP